MDTDVCVFNLKIVLKWILHIMRPWSNTTTRLEAEHQNTHRRSLNGPFMKQTDRQQLFYYFAANSCHCTRIAKTSWPVDLCPPSAITSPGGSAGGASDCIFAWSTCRRPGSSMAAHRCAPGGGPWGCSAWWSCDRTGSSRKAARRCGSAGGPSGCWGGERTFHTGHSVAGAWVHRGPLSPDAGPAPRCDAALGGPPTGRCPGCPGDPAGPKAEPEGKLWMWREFFPVRKSWWLEIETLTEQWRMASERVFWLAAGAAEWQLAAWRQRPAWDAAVSPPAKSLCGRRGSVWKAPSSTGGALQKGPWTDTDAWFSSPCSPRTCQCQQELPAWRRRRRCLCWATASLERRLYFGLCQRGLERYCPPLCVVESNGLWLVGTPVLQLLCGSVVILQLWWCVPPTPCPCPCPERGLYPWVHPHVFVEMRSSHPSCVLHCSHFAGFLIFVLPLSSLMNCGSRLPAHLKKKVTISDVVCDWWLYFLQQKRKEQWTFVSFYCSAVELKSVKYISHHWSSDPGLRNVQMTVPVLHPQLAE